MANKHMRSCSVLQVNSEMQTVTAVSYYFRPTRVAAEFNKLDTIKWCRGWKVIGYLVRCY